MGRRQVREFRAAEALTLIGADRDQQVALLCPTCQGATIERTPPREPDMPTIGRVTLRCSSCGRSASYVERAVLYSPEAPRIVAISAVAAAVSAAITQPSVRTPRTKVRKRA